MKFAIQPNLDQINPDECLILGIFETGEMTLPADKLMPATYQFIQNLIKEGDFTGKSGQTLMLYPTPALFTHRILLVGCGKNPQLNERDYRKALQLSINTLSHSKIAQITVTLTIASVSNRDTAWKIKQAVEVISDSLYRFEQFKSEPTPQPTLENVFLAITDNHELKNYEKALNQGLAIATGITLTKNLANMPSNICTPAYLAEEAKQFAKEYPTLSATILDEKEIEELGMGAFLAVAKGSKHSPKLICLEYKGAAENQAPIVFVGKGITFDTGGVSLKPADSMVGMKYDMCGAATVFGTLKAAAELQLPLNLVGIIAAAENMPSGTAAKPEDIVTTLSGQTVEIMNTDAEGRLVLCDALTYSQRYKPAAIIDIATLTGAVVIALGTHASGLLANNEKLAHALLTAGNESFDRAWQMPLWDEYQDQLKSPFADMSNVGGRAAGTITAACFLSRFTKKFPWAHLDVAGTAAMMMGGNDRYATGRPVPLLVQYLINHSTV